MENLLDNQQMNNIRKSSKDSNKQQQQQQQQQAISKPKTKNYDDILREHGYKLGRLLGSGSYAKVK